MNRRELFAGSLAASAVALGACSRPAAKMNATKLLNVSYDPTRELYEQYNAAFAAWWKGKGNADVTVRQSHGGSSAQARSVIDGVNADVVTLALAADIDTIAEKTGFLPRDWQGRLPHNSSPYTSTIVFLVKKGNPKAIKDWGDLVKPDVGVITPNPKTSGGARWNYLAAYAYGRQAGGDAGGLEYLKALFKNVPVLDTGARGSTVTFVERGVGDVLLAWESEAHLSVEKLGKGEFEIVVPSISVLAEPPVAVIDKVAEKNGSLELANAYLNYLYDDASQEIIAQNYYRPTSVAVAARYADRFPQLKLASIADFGGWTKVQKEQFEYGGVFDQITKK
ncbi:sulfate ABC transporter substrate-binding protein [Asticcacaulis sp. AC402]|uniref:sulfate ABC transporter substrate-binding protein n=1 Tax=Asticcacaulis sp. AC402 TaxID=1282361 RepID=UPI0003C3D899|nr:sulfate ABC transporter substrate-binding protein [Asticcacaulis sp. AC402]ESQ75624.1 ABC transporter permease [Asticcacaulis sp. AC402]